MSMISCLYVEPEKELFRILMNELREEKPDLEFSSDDNVQQKFENFISRQSTLLLNILEFVVVHH